MPTFHCGKQHYVHRCHPQSDVKPWGCKPIPKRRPIMEEFKGLKMNNDFNIKKGMKNICNFKSQN